MKIIHISDLHLDTVYRTENYYKAHQLLEHICDTGFDHLVITGDLTENGDKPALKLVRSLLKKFGLLRSHKTTIIIGNHDIFGGVHLAEDIINFPKRCRLTDYNTKVHEFTSVFTETYSSTLNASKTRAYPLVKEFDEFIILGLNSISEYSIASNPFASNGSISDKQLQTAEDLIRIGGVKNKKVMVLTHHHFNRKSDIMNVKNNPVWNKIENQTMKLRRKSKIIRRLSQLNSSIVLHGHVHESSIYERNGMTFVNAGASVFGNDKSKLSYCVIETHLGMFYPKIVTIERIQPKPVFARHSIAGKELPAFRPEFSVN